MKSLALTCLLALLPLACASSRSETNPKVSITAEPTTFAIEKMRDAKISSEFIDLMRTNAVDPDRDEIITKNILAFLDKADYSTHYSKKALKNCRIFLKKYKISLSAAQKQFGVAKEAIAALLWVETKYGRDIGHHPIAKSYFDLLQSDHPQIIELSIKLLKTKAAAASEENLTLIRARSSHTATRALNELIALDQMYSGKTKLAFKLHGSFAGAFGIPQFVPSSYQKWAKSKKGKLRADLFSTQDAIMSVANYLSQNGWTPDSIQGQKDALFHYNHAQGYVDVILKIAAALR